MKKKLNCFERFSVLFTALTVFQIVLRVIRRFWHFPAPAAAAFIFDSSLRRRVQPPLLVLQRSGVQPGMKVLEVGCGNGALIPDAARLVGAFGEVHALDVQTRMLALLEAKLKQPPNRFLSNVRLHLADARQLPFKDESLDLAYYSSSLFEVPGTPTALREARRVLKTGGILAITEFLPDPDYRLEHEVIRLGTRCGFTYQHSEGSLLHYTVRFTKKG